ncbi:hypothetical protein PFISCL1PPCAC_3625, partial [Pristionchus fissidentatus]
MRKMSTMASSMKVTDRSRSPPLRLAGDGFIPGLKLESLENLLKTSEYLLAFSNWKFCSIFLKISMRADECIVLRCVDCLRAAMMRMLTTMRTVKGMRNL